MVSILFISTANCRRKEFQFELVASLIVLGLMDPCVYRIRWYTMIRSVGSILFVVLLLVPLRFRPVLFFVLPLLLVVLLYG